MFDHGSQLSSEALCDRPHADIHLICHFDDLSVIPGVDAHSVVWMVLQFQEHNADFKFKPTLVKFDPTKELQKIGSPRDVGLFLSTRALTSVMSVRHTAPSHYRPPFNGSHPPPGQEIPTDYRSFFEFDESPPSSPSKVKNFFGSLRNRARSNPDNEGDFKPRQRSRTNPFDDRNKLKGILDSWGASSKNKTIDDWIITEDVPPVPKLPEMSKLPNIRIKPLVLMDVAAAQNPQGAEADVFGSEPLQAHRPRGVSSPIRPGKLTPKASLPSLNTAALPICMGLNNKPDGPRVPGFEQRGQWSVNSGSAHKPQQDSGSPLGPMTFIDEPETSGAPSPRGALLDVTRSSFRSSSSSDGSSIRTPTSAFPPVDPVLRIAAGESMLRVNSPQIEPLPPISPFGVSFPAASQAPSCAQSKDHEILPQWPNPSMQPLLAQPDLSVESRSSDSPDLQRSEESDPAGDLSIWWCGDGAYYYDSDT